MIISTRRRVEALEGNRPRLGLVDSEARHGMAVVVGAVTWCGKGTLCDIEILSNERPSGITYHDAICRESLLVAGAIVSWQRSDNGSIEIVAGGGGPKTENISKHVTEITGATWIIGTTVG
jgi:hypothetical protein